jgi:peroxiredoxin
MPITVGQRIPPARLAEIRDGEIVEINTESLFSGRRAIVIGAPGAFTPICTEKHLPDFVAGADRLRAAGFDTIICLATNDPWTVGHWARVVDPERKIRFLSDGNLEFCRKMGLTTIRQDLYLGERTSRFLMILNNAVIERLSVEALAEQLTRTRYDDIYL